MRLFKKIYCTKYILYMQFRREFEINVLKCLAYLLVKPFISLWHTVGLWQYVGVGIFIGIVSVFKHNLVNDTSL